MAVSGSGTKSRTSIGMPAMEDRITTTPVNPRSGAAKKAQTSFDTKWGMKDMNTPKGTTSNLSKGSTVAGLRGAGGGYPGIPDGGGDIDGKNPLDPYPGGKLLVKQPKTLGAKWGMKDGNGNGLDGDISGKVLGEAILSGGSLPSGESYGNAQPVRKPGG